MQICQLITALGLCLSVARAASVTPPSEDAIKSFVMMITDPEAHQGSSPAFSRLTDSLHDTLHSPAHHEANHQLITAVAPLLQSHQQNAISLAESYVGFRDTVTSTKLRQANPTQYDARLQAYRNSIYSQMKILADSKFSLLTADKLEEIRITMKSNPASIEIFKKFEQEVAKSTPHPEVKLEMLSQQQINDQLRKTTVSGMPDPILIDGTTFRKLMNSHAQLHQHQHHHTPLVPNPKPIQAAA